MGWGYHWLALQHIQNYQQEQQGHSHPAPAKHQATRGIMSSHDIKKGETTCG
jgi:hypothetical protein